MEEDKLEARRRETERREHERREAERRQAERRESERREAERREVERRETERREAESREADRRQAERHEAEKQDGEEKQAKNFEIQQLVGKGAQEERLAKEDDAMAEVEKVLEESKRLEDSRAQEKEESRSSRPSPPRRIGTAGPNPAKWTACAGPRSGSVERNWQGKQTKTTRPILLKRSLNLQGQSDSQRKTTRPKKFTTFQPMDEKSKGKAEQSDGAPQLEGGEVLVSRSEKDGSRDTGDEKFVSTRADKGATWNVGRGRSAARGKRIRKYGGERSMVAPVSQTSKSSVRVDNGVKESSGPVVNLILDKAETTVDGGKIDAVRSSNPRTTTKSRFQVLEDDDDSVDLEKVDQVPATYTKTGKRQSVTRPRKESAESGKKSDSASQHGKGTAREKARNIADTRVGGSIELKEDEIPVEYAASSGFAVVAVQKGIDHNAEDERGWKEVKPKRAEKLEREMVDAMTEAKGWKKKREKPIKEAGALQMAGRNQRKSVQQKEATREKAFDGGRNVPMKEHTVAEIGFKGDSHESIPQMETEEQEDGAKKISSDENVADWKPNEGGTDSVNVVISTTGVGGWQPMDPDTAAKAAPAVNAWAESRPSILGGLISKQANVDVEEKEGAGKNGKSTEITARKNMAKKSAVEDRQEKIGGMLRPILE